MAGNDDSNTINITIDGVVFRFDPKSITAKHELRLWREAKLRLPDIVSASASEPSLIEVAAIVFLARLADGEDVSFDAVAESISLDSDISFDGGDAGPEARGVS